MFIIHLHYKKSEKIRGLKYQCYKYTVTKIIPLSNLLEPKIMDSGLWLDLSPNILDSSINLWVKDMMS